MAMAVRPCIVWRPSGLRRRQCPPASGVSVIVSGHLPVAIPWRIVSVVRSSVGGYRRVHPRCLSNAGASFTSVTVTITVTCVADRTGRVRGPHYQHVLLLAASVRVMVSSRYGTGRASSVFVFHVGLRLTRPVRELLMSAPSTLPTLYLTRHRVTW